MNRPAYISPHTLVSKICKNCEREFTSPVYYNKEYCSPSCRRRQKHSRERLRDVELKPATALFDPTRFSSMLNDPTEGALDALAAAMLASSDTRPALITGVVPHWNAPEGIILVKQQGVENEYIMLKTEVDVMSLLK